MSAITPETPARAEKPGADEAYKVGTLSYTLPGLFLMMLWLLWGDFCFTIMQAVFPAIAPLILGKLEAPNWLIALFLSTIPGLLNATVCPFVSYWSDRYRSPLGRRIPFILYTIPFLCLFLVLIGVAPYLAEWLVGVGWLQDARVATLALLGMFIVGFQFFNMFVGSVYYYLFNDVVPARFLSRFLATFRVVGVAATGGFFLFVFPHAETHYAAIFVGAAVLYGVVFVLMCRYVKEGQYPPPPIAEGRQTVLGGIGSFFRESFSRRFYWLFYLSIAFWGVSGVSDVFLIFFSRAAGLSLEQYGLYTGIGAGISAALLIPCGVLSDRFHPLRTMLTACVLATGCSVLQLVFLVIEIPPEMGFAVWSGVFGLSIPVMALFTASELPVYMSILPKHRFGQFCSATALLQSLFTVVAGLVCGLLIDWVKAIDGARAYLYLPLWPSVFKTLSAVGLVLLYREWKKLGGDQSYSPPRVHGEPDEVVG